MTRGAYARGLAALGLLCAGVASESTVFAADHSDSPAAQSEPSADLADFYAWTDMGGEKLNMVMTSMPYAEAGAVFGDATQYAYHVHAHSAFGVDPTMSTLILCQFYTETQVECWAQRGGQTVSYLEGDATTADGVANADGTMRIYGGVRNDPFFFNGEGFGATANLVRGAVEGGGLSFDDNACPLLDEGTASTLVTQLSTAPDGGAARDFYAETNVMALVLQVDLDLVSDADNRVFSLWATTHAAE